MTYVNAELRVDVKNRTGVDECPIECIYEGGLRPNIRPDAGVDCVRAPAGLATDFGARGNSAAGLTV